MQEYGLEDIFGKGYDSDEEEVVEIEEIGIIPQFFATMSHQCSDYGVGMESS